MFRLEKKLNQEGTCLTLDGDISTEWIDAIETSCDETVADGKPVDLFYHPRFGIQHLADLTSYCQGQERLGALYADPDAWARKAILIIASSGKFSSDRTIAEYANDIRRWGPCPVL